MQEEMVEFPVGWCVGCGRHVLTHVGANADDTGQRLCVHCDAAVDAELKAVQQGELDSHGYSLVEDFNCGSPNCGGGRCGRG
jgi:hypothetical protein